MVVPSSFVALMVADPSVSGIPIKPVGKANTAKRSGFSDSIYTSSGSDIRRRNIVNKGAHSRIILSIDNLTYIWKEWFNRS